MKLILTSGPYPIEYLLTKQTTTLGRAAEADISLDDMLETCSYHAVIWQNRGLFAISDWNNQGGVEVNGKPVVPGQPLWAGDRITLGEVELFFLRDTASLADYVTSEQQQAIEQVSLQENVEANNALQHLASLDEAKLDKLRRQSPAIGSAIGLGSFLKQGLTQAYSRQGKGLFGLTLTLPATLLTLFQAVRARFPGNTAQNAFPEGVWQHYAQSGLREDTARHANETDGFHRSIPRNASEVDQAAAWVFQCITTLFEYESLLENEWVERTLLHLVDETVVDAVVTGMAAGKFGPDETPSLADLEVVKRRLRQQEIERIEIEAERLKAEQGLSGLQWAWVKKRPYRKPAEYLHETYPQYRRRLFLEFLVKVAEKLSPEMGPLIWDRYYEHSSTALPAYQAQMSILFTLKPERYQEKKTPVSLIDAKIGFVAGGRYYLIHIAQRDDRGRLLVFKPGKPDDPGEPLILLKSDSGALVDQQGRKIKIDRKGSVTITDAIGRGQIKTLHRTPASRIKAVISAILRDARVLPAATAQTDIYLAAAPRVQQETLGRHLPRLTQAQLATFADVPIIINWDQRNRTDTLHQIRSARRGIGSHALTIFRTQNSFVFDQSHIFFDAIWGMVISQIITDGAIDTCKLMAGLPNYTMHTRMPAPLRLQDSPQFLEAAKTYSSLAEVTTEVTTPDLSIINSARRHLARYRIPATVNDILTIYRAMHNQRYTPSLKLQRALAQLRIDGHGALADQVESMWQKRKTEPVSLFLPMDATYVDPKLRLYPATFKNFLPELVTLYEETMTLLNEQTYHPTPHGATAFQDKRTELMANMMVLTEYFKMLKRITRQGESISTAAIQYLAHLPSTMQNTLDMVPEHIGALSEILKGEEVFSNVGRVAPSSSLVRFTSAKDGGASKRLVWGIMCDSAGTLKISLRDFRPHVPPLIKLGYGSLAELIAWDDLESYSTGLNNFAEGLTKIVRAKIKSSIEV